MRVTGAVDEVPLAHPVIQSKPSHSRNESFIASRLTREMRDQNACRRRGGQHLAGPTSPAAAAAVSAPNGAPFARAHVVAAQVDFESIS